MSPMRAVLLSLCTLLIGGGLGYGATQLGGSDDEGPGETIAVTTGGHTTVAAPTDFTACATQATFGCYQRGFRALVSAQDPGVALDKLDALSKTDSYVLRTCHPLAHEIGHLAFAKYKTVQAAEGFARETCWSGYHHGVMESYISQFNDGQLRARMNGICKQEPDHPYSLAYYNCWHGLGHGLTIRFTQRVFKSLDFCDFVKKDWERQSCYSGVFMQNIVADGSGMHKAVDLKPSDPIYPCNAVTKEQKPSCYLMQTSYVLKVRNWNLPVAFGVCDRRREGLRGHLLSQHGPGHLGRRPARSGQDRDAVRRGREGLPRRVHLGSCRERRLRPPRPHHGRRALQARPPCRSQGLPHGDRAGSRDALDVVAEERALARLPRGDAQLGDAREHRERDHRADERATHLAGRLVVPADRPRIGLVGREQREPVRELARCGAHGRREAVARADEPLLGLIALVAGQRRIEEVVGVREQPIARLDARDALR